MTAYSLSANPLMGERSSERIVSGHCGSLRVRIVCPGRAYEFRMEAQVFPVKQIRDRKWRAAGLLALILAGIPALASAQEPTADAWLGKRVIQRFNNFPLRRDDHAVLESGMEIHIYKATRRDGNKLWLEGEDDGPTGWASTDQLVILDEALVYLADRIRVHPDEAFYHALRAAVLSDRRELDGALDDWNKIVELDPEDVASYIGRAKLRLARTEWEKAIDDLTQAIALDPVDAYCYRLRAHARSSKHDFDHAIDDCNQAIKLDPQSATGLVTRAQAWLGKQELDKAIADATVAVRLDDSLPLGYVYRGLAWSRKKDFDKAIADYNEAIRLDPRDPEFYYNRAWAWQQKGDTARAMADYGAGVSLDPDYEFPRTKAGPGSTPPKEAEQKEAIDHFLLNLPLEHTSADVVAKVPAGKDRQTGVVPASFDPQPAPQTDLRRANAGDPRSSALGSSPATVSRDLFGIAEPQTALEFTARAGDWLHAKLYDKAIADCNLAIALGCHDPRARIYRGLARREKKEYDQAIADYDEAIQLDAQSDFAYIARSAAWSAKLEYHKAEADLAQAERLAPESPVTCNARAWMWATCPDAKYRDGRKSVEAATKACELTDWDEAGIIDTLAAGYAETGDFASAVKWQNRAIELEKDAKDKAEFVDRLKLYEQKTPYRDRKP
jgi:tetratricopeptide (TPR) repeat protein